MNDENRSDRSHLKNQGGGVSVGRNDDSVTAISDENSEAQIEDRGTNQSEAARVLKKIRDEVFDSSDEKLALALGRSREEIAEWLNGEGTIDGDALLKVRALARERS